MTRIATTLQAFFTDRLASQRNASAHTISGYRDTFRILLQWIHKNHRIGPDQLDFADLSADRIMTFLDYLETVRANSAATRNARLAAIRSFYHYAALEHPEHGGEIARILAIPSKKTVRTDIDYLTKDEELALLEAPDLSTWYGRRDQTLLAVMLHTGLRITETINLTNHDLVISNTATTGSYVSCQGKGRKHRATPLNTQTVALLKRWLAELASHATGPVFPTRQGKPLSRDAIERLLAKHVETATVTCPSLATKNVTAHVLRHTCAMRLLHAGTNIAVIALWLGHESIQTTNIYLHADMTIKDNALAKTSPPDLAPGRYQPTGDLLEFLENL